MTCVSVTHLEYADKAGIEYSFEENTNETDIHPNTVDIVMTGEGGRRLTVRGESLGGGKVMLTRINGVKVQFTGEYHALIAVYEDHPGVVAAITAALNDNNVNIAFLRVYREKKGGRAYTIVESDEITAEAVENTGDLARGRYNAYQEVTAGIYDRRRNFALCGSENITIADVMRRRESTEGELDPQTVEEKMKKALDIMRDSAHKPMSEILPSRGGMIGGEAAKLSAHAASGRSICGSVLTKALIYSQAVPEVNASMGVIVAAPTAGSSGVLPAVLFALEEEFGLDEATVLNGLFTAGAIGCLLMRNASVAGAEAGCQAEVGSASAMAAAAAVAMFGGSPQQSLDAASIALSNMLGLVCDPIAGLVEAPCQSRNAAGAANALTSAESVLSGIKAVVPFSEMAEAMYKVGKRLAPELRETALGGCAATPTGCAYKCSIFGCK